jgi:hypothetical protein
MAKGKTITTKGVRYTDENGKKTVLTKEEFITLLKQLNRKAQANKTIKIIEESEIDE